jgi:hypothetical protein
MGFAVAAFIISLVVQLAVCFADTKVIGKLIPLLIESAVFLCLIVPLLTPLQESIEGDARLMMILYALMVLIGMAGIGIAWLIYGVKKIVYNY